MHFSPFKMLSCRRVSKCKDPVKSSDGLTKLYPTCPAPKRETTLGTWWSISHVKRMKVWKLSLQLSVVLICDL